MLTKSLQIIIFKHSEYIEILGILVPIKMALKCIACIARNSSSMPPEIIACLERTMVIIIEKDGGPPLANLVLVLLILRYVLVTRFLSHTLYCIKA